jgi:hypothetical protein
MMIEVADTPSAPSEPTSSAPALRRARRARVVQVALGCLWILDAALQFQPRMFGQGLVTQMMLPAAQGQPAPVSWSITELARFVRPDVGVWNFFFGAIQLSIGVGMLFRRTVKPAIVAMVAWSFGVWWFGEGFGMLLTGSASPLMGAPGAVLLYPLIALLVWPADASTASVEPGVASSAAASGPLGARAPLVAWSGFWAVSAVLWLFPANRARGSVSSMLDSMAGGQPSWYAHFERATANALAHGGSALPWIFALVSLAIAIGPWLARRPTPFLAAGVALEAIYWVTGMAMGGILTGMGTDPNAAPLVALLAVAMVPTLHAVPASSPARELLGRHPVAGTVISAGTLMALVLGATYPVAPASASASAGTHSQATSSQPGMAGMAMGAAPSGTSTHAKAALAMPGMGGQPDPTWHYTGPALPQAERSLLTAVFDETEKGHAMQTPSCTRPPTVAQVVAAMRLVQATSSAVAKYKDLAVAKADGYVPTTDPRYPVVHYLNYRYMQSKDVLDPNYVQSLVYTSTPGGPVLVAAMYLMPSVGESGPMPGGCLTQWHAHTNLCVGGPTGTISGFTTNGKCPAGENPLQTPEMMHVWQVPVPGGPLAMDPTDEQIVESAVMAQQEGQAPVAAGSQGATGSGSVGA